MTLFDLNFRIEAESTQKATALRSKLADLLAEDKDIAVVNEAQAQVTQTYRVSGVDTASGEVFNDTIEAVDESTAGEQTKTTRVVAVITSLP